jgi:hypothetical protein
MIPLLVIIALGVLAILAVALRMAIDLRAIRASLLPDIHAALLRQAWSYPLLGHNHHPDQGYQASGDLRRTTYSGGK